jgi:hypothetical protein
MDPFAVGVSHCGDAGCHAQVQAFSLSSDSTTLYRIGVVVPSGERRHALVQLATDATSGQAAEVNAMAIREAFVVHVADHIFDVIEVTGTGSPGSQQDFRITFSSNPGNHDLIEVDALQGPGRVVAGSLAIATVGTTEELECSGRGLCDRRSGTCDCFPGYGREDCGVQVTRSVYAERRRLSRIAAKRRSQLEFHELHHTVVAFSTDLEDAFDALDLDAEQAGLE